MEIDEKKIYTGKIIYWNYNYGFLECRDFDNNIYFHSKTLKPEMVKEIRLFDIFTFKIGISISEKNKGKIFAKKLKYKEKGNFSEYLKKIGVIYDWNGKFGFIDYPTEGKKIFLYNTRLLYIKNIINGDLIVFNPVKSTKDNSQLFAFFAYPIQFEKDILFLKQQYLNYQIPELKEYILSQQNSFEVLTNSDRFEIELINLGGKLNYINVEKLINDFKNNYKYIPDYDLLSRYISEFFLIQLWENNVIDIYDVELITKYFINTNTDTKKLIINKIKESDKEFILRKHFEHLKEIGKFKRVNNELKTFLGIIYKNEKNINQTLFQDTKEFLLLNLEPKDLINLWLNGFIDDLKESFIIENFDISNFTLIQQLLSKKKEYNELLMKIYEQYFFNLAKEKNIDFESEYPNLINYLHIFKENFEDRYKEIILLIELILKPYQKFILYLFDIEINFDAENYFNENQNEINHYFKIKYILKKPLVSEYLNSIEITQDNLQQFASNYNWNDLLNPIYPKLENKKSEKVYKKNHSFLHDIEEFNKLYQTKYNLRDLAEIIYNSIEKYTVIHIRLWLYVFQDKQHYDYIGFSVPFKALFNEEKKKIREIINFTDKQEEFESETEEVVPCEYIIEKDENTIIYNAHIENIYFGEGYLRLRLENKEYTDKYEKYFCGQELNRIPSNHSYNKIDIIIKVKDKKIIKIIGLDEILKDIHYSEIEKTLVKNTKANILGNEIYSYAEDWSLRKEIIDFLKNNQADGKDTKIINEPKNYFRRLDKNSGIDTFEKVELFTLDINNEYVIVWENIDLSEDKATYVFKSTYQNYEIQLKKLGDTISSYAQLRSALSSKQDKQEIIDLKRFMGFIGSIRKQRGKKDAFVFWLKNFEETIKLPIPEIPENFEIYDNVISSPRNTFRVNKRIKTTDIIKESELNTINDIDSDFIEKSKISINDNIEKILSSLIKFNNYFTENLNI